MYGKYKVGDAVEFHYAEMFFFGRKQHNLFFAQIKLEGAGILNPE